TIVTDIRNQHAERIKSCARAISGPTRLTDLELDQEISMMDVSGQTVQHCIDALYRLEQGNYGTCSECHEEISEKRLRALPFAARCTKCEDEREMEERREAQRRKQGRPDPYSL